MLSLQRADSVSQIVEYSLLDLAAIVYRGLNNQNRVLGVNCAIIIYKYNITLVRPYIRA